MSHFDGKWLASVRGILFGLAEMTQTTLPDPRVIEGYQVALAREANGPHSVALIQAACNRIVENWRFPSFPKVADIIWNMRQLARDPGFLESIRETDSGRLLEEHDTAHKGAYSPEELAAAQECIDRFKAKMKIS